MPNPLSITHSQPTALQTYNKKVFIQHKQICMHFLTLHKILSLRRANKIPHCICSPKAIFQS